MNVLLIEPNQVLGQTYATALRRANHVVDWQKTAQAAITAADRKRPDAIILEPQLTGHSGIEFLYEFRSYTDWQTIPAVMHTFIPEEHFVLQRYHFQNLSVAAYLYKPMTTLQELTRTVGRLPLAV